MTDYQRRATLWREIIEAVDRYLAGIEGGDDTAPSLKVPRPLGRCPVGDEWLTIHADDWDRVARSTINLDDPVWMTPKQAAHELNLEPSGGAIYDRIKRRPIAVKFRGRWYVNMVRARTLTGTLPGELK